jgi:hypothetical protein
VTAPRQRTTSSGATPPVTTDTSDTKDEVTRLKEELAELRNQLEEARSRPRIIDDEPTAPIDQPPPRPLRSGWWRVPVAAILVTIAALLAPLSVVATWARDQVGDTDRYVQTVGPLASDPAVQKAIIDRTTAEIVSRLDIPGLTSQAVEALQSQGLPPRVADGLTALSVPLANGVDNFISDRVSRFVKSPEFEQAWIEANRNAHTQLVAVLTGKDTQQVQVTCNAVSINLAVLIETVKKKLVAAGFTRAANLPVVNAQFTVFESDDLAKAQRGFRVLDKAAHWLPILALVLLAVAIYISRSRRKTLLVAALAVAAGMLLLGAALNIFRSVYLNAIPPDQLSTNAAASIYDQVVSFIRFNLRAVLVVALAVATGAWLSGPSASAVATRSGIRRATAAVRGGGERVGLRTGPVGAFVYRYRTLLRSVVIAVAALVYVQAAHPTGSWTLGVLAYTVVALAVVELRAAPPAERHTDAASELPGPPTASPPSPA